ncbi:MAG: ATP-binding protein [Pseudomonadota bacterium]
MRWDDFSNFDHIGHPVFVLAPDAHNRPVYRFLNTVGCGLLDKTREDIEGRPAHEIFSGRAAYSIYRRQCAAWADACTTEYEILLPIGAHSMVVRTNLVAVHDDAGHMTHMIGTSLDITPERTHRSEQVLSAAAAQDLEDLMCLAAHDLRSPLCNLKTLADMMRRDFVDHGDGKIELINMIDTVSDRALGVVSGIMGQAMSMNDEGESAVFDLGDMCDDVTVMLDPMGRHSVSYPRINLQADFIVVHIILRNMIDNAIKHSGRDFARISITAAPMNAERLLFTVCDNGVGFEQSALDAQQAGTGGFGLMGVNRLVRSRGGQMTFGARKDAEGARVEVELPGRIVTAEQAPAPTLRAG